MELLLYYGLIFALQFGMCFWPRKWLRLLPMMLFGGFSALCGGVWLLSILLSREDTLGFPAAILTIVGAMQFLAAAMGWAVYSFIQLVQKQRK